MTKVKCIAEHCNFWLPGDFCVAGRIDVTNNEEGRDASQVDDTMCVTFTAREAEISMDEEQNEKTASLLVDEKEKDAGIHPAVGCIVTSCIYWEQGDTCSKDHIEILYRESTTARETACEDYKPVNNIEIK